MKNYVTAATTITAPAINIEATQRDFLMKRIREIRNKHYDVLRTQFFLDAEDGPRTAQALIDAIKNDEFTLDQKKIDDATANGEIRWFNSFFGIRWGKNAPDQKGYQVGLKALDAAMQDVIDIATLAPIEEAHAALKTFQSWTYAPAA